jgi:mono/diheme cytochrome c family protein
MRWVVPIAALTLSLLMATGCADHMRDQPKYEPLEVSTFFDDGKSERQLVPNTVARGRLWTDTHLYNGTVDGAPAETFPFPVTMEVLERGQERYTIYCTPCHGYAGYGEGIVVQSGLSPPPSFHTERLRNVPVGYMFDVITNGFGAMYGYAYRIPPEDRWAIVAYVQALQRSQNASLADAPAEVQEELDVR